MDLDKNIKTLKNVLFAAGGPVSVEKLAEAIGKSVEEILEILEIMQKEEDIFEIVRVGDGFQLTIAEDERDNITKVFDKRPNPRLTNAALEVLSIIAYNPNVTRAQIEKIRGVVSDSVVSRLLDYGLIEESGKLNILGRPMGYTTTDKFLVTFGLSDISDLPKIEDIEELDEMEN